MLNNLAGSHQFNAESYKEGFCEIHGKYKTIVIAGHDCGCMECKRIQIESEGHDYAKTIMSEMEASVALRRLIDAGVLEKYRHATFDNWLTDTPMQEKILSVAREYADNFELMREKGRCIVMTGSEGTGKTHLAVAILNTVLQNGYSALFTTATHAFHQINGCFHKKSEITQEDAYKIYTSPELLVIDDIGIAKDSDNTIQITYGIIYTRYLSNLPTIVTTNYNLEQLKDFIGVQTVDRLRENSGLMLPMNWPSRRGRQD